MTSVLVLGAGHIGTFVARDLVAAGVQVVAADADPAPGYFWRFGPTQHAELVSLDLEDADGLRALVEDCRCAAIVLCAGVVGPACEIDPERAWRINVRSTAAVAALARQLKLRLVFLSSLAVYGRGSTPALEEAGTQPCSLYGRTKAAAERLLAAEWTAGLDVRIARPCGTFGPIRIGTGSQSARQIESILLTAIRYGEITLRGPAAGGTQYFYVKDLAKAITRLTLTDFDRRRVIVNVGPATRTTLHDLKSAIEAALPDVRVHTQIDDELDGASGPFVEVGLARDLLGFEPHYSLADGLGDYVREGGFLG
jgi:UDP-glucose 4-epimerase